NSVYEGGSYKHSGLKFYTGEYQDRHLAVPGDLVVANTEQGHDRLLIGYGALIPCTFSSAGIFSHHLYRVRERQAAQLPNTFLYLLLRERQTHDLVSGFANGTTVNMLPVDALTSLRVLV